ncbi:MAG: hypothetical protein LW806_04175 [Planctomycetaceae bacterium]|nr:hypothetical protein [Planctomycetaceae bacterium]
MESDEMNAPDEGEKTNTPAPRAARPFATTRFSSAVAVVSPDAQRKMRFVPSPSIVVAGSPSASTAPRTTICFPRRSIVSIGA